jgi:hypothetical protein
MDEAPQGVSERERANQSNQRVELCFRFQFSWRVLPCPRGESNSHLRFRKPPFYPLNYEDFWIFDFRFAIFDCPAELASGPTSNIQLEDAHTRDTHHLPTMAGAGGRAGLSEPMLKWV